MLGFAESTKIPSAVSRTQNKGLEQLHPKTLSLTVERLRNLHVLFMEVYGEQKFKGFSYKPCPGIQIRTPHSNIWFHDLHNITLHSKRFIIGVTHLVTEVETGKQ